MAVVYNPEGKRRQYGYVWSKVRLVILDRDASFHGGIRTCECCGAVEGELVYAIVNGRKRAVYRVDEKTGKRVRVRVCMEVDHIIPFVHGGGEMDPDNLITLCRKCNRSYGDRMKDPETLYKYQILAYERNRAILGEGDGGAGQA